MEKELDWGNLSFGYIPTDYNVRCYYRDGKWGDIEVSQSETVNLHIAATALHYGQEIFEGLKAFRGKDGKIRIFRLEENAKRIIDSAKGIMMEPVPAGLFAEMVKKVVKLNERFVPPYGSGASLYIRPLEIGISAQVWLRKAGIGIPVPDTRVARRPLFQIGLQANQYMHNARFRPRCSQRDRPMEGWRKLRGIACCR